MSDASPRAESPRYHALDRARALAMLLGVVYHSLLFRMFVGGGPGGGPPGPGGGGSESFCQEWIHSFRMPLFFLISGFFGRMMLQKYGLKAYLEKRWVRIGVPLILGVFFFGPAYVLTRDAIASPRGPGGPPPSARGAGPGPGAGEFPAPPEGGPGFAEGPPRGRRGPGGPPRGGPGGPGGGGALGRRLFGDYASLFQLNHLWFLWYLLLFATAAPWVAGAVARLVPTTVDPAFDADGKGLMRSGLAPLALGLATTPALMLAGSGGPGPGGWSLGMPGSIFTTFPDFLFRLDALMPFYFLYFLAGWWLHRERGALGSMSRMWPSYLVVGTIGFLAAGWLSDAYARDTAAPHYAWIRLGGYAVYCVGSAATVAAFLGFFQRHLDRPSPTWRYLADTALWVYLAHQPFVVLALACLAPLGLPWWALTVIVTLTASALCLLLYEAVVKPTFLVRLFGPASAARARLAPRVDRVPEEAAAS